MTEQPETTPVETEGLVAENVSEAIWLRLRRLTSSVLCRRIPLRRSPTLPPDIIDTKANQTAWAVRSALGYWETGSSSLNARTLNRYYALLQISIADQVSSPDSKSDLLQVQRHTEMGHGLFTLVAPDESFPNNYKVGCLKSGHFYMFCKHKGIPLKAHAFDRRPRDYSALMRKRDALFRLVTSSGECRNFNQSLESAWTHHRSHFKFITRRVI
jgi:hypothetical protein